MMIHATVVHAELTSTACASCSTSAARASTRATRAQPMTEEALLTGPLEPTNEAYAIAKIAGIKLCQSYRSAVRLQLHLRDADEPLRPERQLRPRQSVMCCRR